MRMLAWFAFAAAACAQLPPDGRALLQAVVDSASSARSWRAELLMITEVIGDHSRQTTDATINVSWKSPNYLRSETSGTNASLTVCDGVSSWHYTPRLNQYTTSPSAQNPLCLGGLMDWTKLLDGQAQWVLS